MKTDWGNVCYFFGESGLRRVELGADKCVCGGMEPGFRSLLQDYFGGGRPDFSVVPLEVFGTGFERGVWSFVRGIPYGRVLSYGEVARALGVSGGARAVGNALAKNPVPVVVPCHRVVGASGLGGFNFGLMWKRFLLALEGFL